MVAAAAWELVERIGMPEARITLAQAVTYLACVPKSNASYLAIDAALADVREGRTVPVPMHIKDSNVRKAAQRSAGTVTGDEYAYAHDHPDAIGMQDYLGVDRRYYEPTMRGAERQLAEHLERARAARAAAKEPPQ
jgi:putative ATPase